MKKARVLLVDDHSLFRKGIASLLGDLKEIEIVGEAGNGQEGIEKARQLKPDIIIMDVEMPKVSGVEAVKVIKNELPQTKVVMLTISEEDADLFNSLKNGAQGYLLKSMEPEELIKEVKDLVNGEVALTKSLAGKILAEFTKICEIRKPSRNHVQYNLTEREEEVLKLVAQGITNKEIAQSLQISENTVKNHLYNIMEKLHLKNRVQIAAFAWREGLVRE